MGEGVGWPPNPDCPTPRSSAQEALQRWGPPSSRGPPPLPWPLSRRGTKDSATCSECWGPSVCKCPSVAHRFCPHASQPCLQSLGPGAARGGSSGQVGLFPCAGAQRPGGCSTGERLPEPCGAGGTAPKGLSRPRQAVPGWAGTFPSCLPSCWRLPGPKLCMARALAVAPWAGPQCHVSSRIWGQFPVKAPSEPLARVRTASMAEGLSLGLHRIPESWWKELESSARCGPGWRDGPQPLLMCPPLPTRSHLLCSGFCSATRCGGMTSDH